MKGAGLRQRARSLGLAPGAGVPGPLNAITDVAGVRVGQVTLRQGADIRTGVTAIVPDAVDRAGGELPAGLFVGNGYGKLIGATQLAELGVIETPIVLTGTLSAFRAADALVSYMLGLPGNEFVTSVNPMVGETNDGYLSDIRSRPVTESDVLGALRSASGGPVAGGAVGAGTGTSALGYKAGIGTSSRTFRLDGETPCTLGVLVQANFSGTLTVRGVPIDPRRALSGRSWGELPGHRDSGGRRPGELSGRPGELSGRPGELSGRPGELSGRPGETRGQTGGLGEGAGEPGDERPGGRWLGGPRGGPAEACDSPNSCMIVVAVDGSLDSRQLTRVARRAVFAMARTGSDFAGSSGDYAVAFATGEGRRVRERDLGKVFAAVMDATEEAILDAVFLAETTIGYLGHVRQAVPLDYVVAMCQQRPSA